MRFKKRYVISDTQLGLLFKEHQFQRVLTRGVYEFWDWRNTLVLRTISLNASLTEGVPADILFLAQGNPGAFDAHLINWQTAEHEVGLVYQDGVLRDIKAPGQQGAYWKTHQHVEIKILSVEDDFALGESLARVLSGARESLLSRAATNAVAVSSVAEGCVGFLMVNGNTVKTLSPGVHMFWKFNRVIEVKQYDLRLQAMEVNGQEILTKDRVSLRINLSATWQINNAEQVRVSLADAKEYLYRELQLALRAVVSTQTLDELLADKNSLNHQVLDLVSEKAQVFGISLNSVGARDIILPGEMKAILTSVVEAQKLAEANLIKRQEETQATRSLHNTAKVMEGNPILLRLKELEVLEKITGKINSLNVYGGLDGVMHDLVRLTDRRSQ
ncbi:MAG: slipin family protein [Marinagarivorans sp.]